MESLIGRMTVKAEPTKTLDLLKPEKVKKVVQIVEEKKEHVAELTKREQRKADREAHRQMKKGK